MKKTLITLSIIGSFFSLQAQERATYRVGVDGVLLEFYGTGGDSSIDLNPSCLDVLKPDPRSIIKDVDGYPFLVVGWGKGYVESKGRILECEGLNILLYNQQLWLKSEGKVIALNPDESIQAVVIEGRRVVSGLLPELRDKAVWMEELSTGGNAVLYKYHTATFVEPKAPVNSYDSGTKARFANKSSLYVNIPEGAPMQLMPEKAAAFLALLPENAKEMQEFLTKNKINLKKEADVVRAIAYYNSL
jgi:hypothetical protein